MINIHLKIPRCEALLKTSCVDLYDEMNCRAAVDFCGSEFSGPFFKTGKHHSTQRWHDTDELRVIGRNIYDVSKDCEGEISDTLCYPITKYVLHPTAELEIGISLLDRTITNYLNQPEVRAQLGVDPSVRNYSSCSNKVGRDFNIAFDEYAVHAEYYVAELLERGINVLIYVGTYDMICNWVSVDDSLIMCAVYRQDILGRQRTIYPESQMDWAGEIYEPEFARLGRWWSIGRQDPRPWRSDVCNDWRGRTYGSLWQTCPSVGPNLEMARKQRAVNIVDAAGG